MLRKMTAKPNNMATGKPTANRFSVGAARLMDDMDHWGYSFRLGSTRAWFEGDAGDARQWLLDHGLIDSKEQPTFSLR